METEFDAIVIGAGPAGSSAAILLAGAGWRVALVEKQVYPRRKVCGECISATNLPILEALGIGNAVRQLAGRPLQHMALVCGARIVRAPLPAYGDPVHQWGLAMGREHLDTLLLEQARSRGVAIFQPWQVRSISGMPGNYVCLLRQAQQDEERLLAASVVIDAHGSWEPPALLEGRQEAPPRSRPSDLFAFKANFADVPLESGLLPVLSFPGGYGGMVIGGANATLAFCMRRDTLMQARSQFPRMKPAEAAYGWVTRHASAAATLLGAGVQCGKWLGSGPIRPGIRLAGRFEGVFRIGNAAGEAHPIIGEGISMALQSAILLGETLIGCRARDADSHAQQRIHAQYARKWHRHFARRIRLSALYAHVAMRPHIFGAILPTLETNPALLTRLARWCGKVHPGPGCDLAASRKAARYA